MTSNVEPFRVRRLQETGCVALTRFDHPLGAAALPTTFSAHEAAGQFRLNIVERGWFRLGYGRREWTLGAGSIFLSRPSDVYRYSHVRHLEPDTCLVVEFSVALADELADIFKHLSLVLPATNRLAYLRLQLSSIASDSHEMSLDTLACELLDAAHSVCNDRHRVYRLEQLKWYARKIGAARELMDADPAGQHSLWRLATQVAMSPFLFARVFRELVGLPPHRYLVRLRLQRARHLLESGMSVTEACYTAGFNNLSHFVRTFHAHFGLVPSALKRAKNSGLRGPAAKPRVKTNTKTFATQRGAAATKTLQHRGKEEAEGFGKFGS